MPEKNDINSLIWEINEKVTRVETKVGDLKDIHDRSEAAYAKSVENEHRIAQLTQVQNWLIGILIGGVLFPLILYIIEHGILKF
ncbi:hemolysin XhlA family protein [Lactobacillus acetotolerans]|uniref:hemolysin XhlA family protein n=1 Tax=Lactobacillus acetotolerans TaxID=1600 RepID=UPI002FD9B68D